MQASQSLLSSWLAVISPSSKITCGHSRCYDKKKEENEDEEEKNECKVDKILYTYAPISRQLKRIRIRKKEGEDENDVCTSDLSTARFTQPCDDNVPLEEAVSYA